MSRTPINDQHRQKLPIRSKHHTGKKPIFPQSNIIYI